MIKRRKFTRVKTLPKLKKELWEVFSKFIKERDKYTCFTCGYKGHGSLMHGGHFIPKSICGIELYFNEKNVHAQCYRCNIVLDGNQYEFGKRLGSKTVKELFKIKKKIVQWKRQNYMDKIDQYSKLTRSSKVISNTSL